MRTCLSRWWAPLANSFIAGAYDMLCFYKRRPLALIASIAWPILMVMMLFLALVLTGRFTEYASSMGVSVSQLRGLVPAAAFLISAIGYAVDSAAMYILWLRWEGLIPYVMSTPGALLRLVTGSSLGSSLVSMVLTAIPFILIAFLLGGCEAVLLILLLLALSFMLTVSMLGIGALVAGVTLNFGREELPLQWLTPFIILVSAVLYPPSVLPPLLNVIGLVFPSRYLADALRALSILFDREKLLMTTLLLLTFAAGYATLYVPGERLVKRAKVKGGFE